MTTDADDVPGTDEDGPAETHQSSEPPPPSDRSQEDDDALADEMSQESFPGSDPPSTWAGGGST